MSLEPMQSMKSMMIQPSEGKHIYLQIYSETGHGGGPHAQANPHWKLQCGLNPHTAITHLGKYKTIEKGEERQSTSQAHPCANLHLHTPVQVR